jgi:putative membrane protein
MATAGIRSNVRTHPRAVTAILSVVGYALVLTAFYGPLPVPPLSRGTVLLFGDAIAVVNALALTSLVAGYRFVRRGEIRKHRAAMLLAFGLILVFLVLYLWKVGGGFEKSIVAPPLPRYLYLGMLAVHILLSVVAVPVVLHAVVLGLTHDVSELPATSHPRVGRVAVAAWSVSLFLGIVTYLLLNHVYAWEPLHRSAVLLAAGSRLGAGAGPDSDSGPVAWALAARRRLRAVRPGPRRRE